MGILASQPAITCSKLPIKTLKQGVKFFLNMFHWRRSGAFIVNFEHISHLVLVLFTFQQVNANWANIDFLPLTGHRLATVQLYLTC